MKKELVKGFTMLMLIVVIALATAVASANAQAVGKISANVPFEFSVGYKTMPAGEYNVRATAGSSAVIIQTADQCTTAIRLSDETQLARKAPHARLVFHRYGDRYFLAEVWNGVDRTGRQLLQSQEENAMERELSSIPANSDAAKAAYETVEVLAVLR